MGAESVAGVQLDPRGGVVVQVTDFGEFARALPRQAKEHGITLREVTPTDESLESVFAYLVSA